MEVRQPAAADEEGKAGRRGRRRLGERRGVREAVRPEGFLEAGRLEIGSLERERDEIWEGILRLETKGEGDWGEDEGLREERRREGRERESEIEENGGGLVIISCCWSSVGSWRCSAAGEARVRVLGGRRELAAIGDLR